MGKFRVWFRLVLALLAVDLLVLAYYWVPPWFGYVGSESYEWAGIGSALTCIPLALLLAGVLAMIWNASKSASK